MIRYALRCAEGHEFEGWFRSSVVFETMRDGGQVACVRCGTAAVDRALMAPAIPSERAAAVAPPPPQPAPQRAGPLPAPRPRPSAAEQAVAELRAHIEATSDYVGLSFATEARAMHEGRTPQRPIHGEARPEEARKLLEDGVPVAPLPFRPRQRMN